MSASDSRFRHRKHLSHNKKPDQQELEFESKVPADADFELTDEEAKELVREIQKRAHPSLIGWEVGDLYGPEEKSPWLKFRYNFKLPKGLKN